MAKVSEEVLVKEELLKSFHEQFSINQNHSQSLFIQFISAVLVVIVGYGLIFSNTRLDAKLIDVVRNADGSMDVSEICYTLFRGKLTTCFAGKEMQLML